MQYATLNDAFESGETEVWFVRPEYFIDAVRERLLPKVQENLRQGEDLLSKTHVLLGKIKSTDCEVIYTQMQGEFWSPNGEANNLIQSKNLSHTSMICGDVIRLPEGNLMMASPIGFVDILNPDSIRYPESI